MKSLPSAQTTPTQRSSLLCSSVSASDSCSIICGEKAFFLAGLSMMILKMWPCVSVRILPSVVMASLSSINPVRIFD